MRNDRGTHSMKKPAPSLRTVLTSGERPPDQFRSFSFLKMRNSKRKTNVAVDIISSLSETR